MVLTEIAIRNAKPKSKAYKLGDSGGLFLHISPSGGKLWRVKFRSAGKEKLLSLGAWPAVSLGTARKERDKARELLAAGADPAREKQKAKILAKVAAANTFADVGREYLDKRKREGAAPRTLDKAEYHLGRFAANLGRVPIGEITAPDVLAVLRVSAMASVAANRSIWIKSQTCSRLSATIAMVPLRRSSHLSRSTRGRSRRLSLSARGRVRNKHLAAL